MDRSEENTLIPDLKAGKVFQINQCLLEAFKDVQYQIENSSSYSCLLSLSWSIELCQIFCAFVQLIVRICPLS